jgi:hypothetical protein
MPYLCRSQANKPSILALYAVDSDGFLYDPEAVSFRIVDLSTNTQVFPASGYEDVTTLGRVDLGVFYAYDHLISGGYTPGSGATVGTHRIDWRFTDAEDDTVTRTWSMKFDIYSAGAEMDYWTYISPNQVRNEGINTTKLSDLRLLDLMERAQQYIERECRQPFRPVRMEFAWDGNESGFFPMGVPIIGVDNLKVNYSTTELDHDQYAVYFSPSLASDPGWQDRNNRGNPRIQVQTSAASDPFHAFGFNGPFRQGKFGAGAKPHKLKGVFGYVEPDGRTPKLISDAMLRVVLATATKMGLGPGANVSSVSGPITRERTDQHEIEYAFSYTASSMDSPLATSTEVLDVLRRHRAPIGISAPTTTWSGLRG